MPKHRWAIGPTFGFGVGYNALSGDIGPVFSVGLGITRRTTFKELFNIF